MYALLSNKPLLRRTYIEGLLRRTYIEGLLRKVFLTVIHTHPRMDATNCLIPLVHVCGNLNSVNSTYSCRLVMCLVNVSHVIII